MTSSSSINDHGDIITQMLADLRHLVVGLTSKERTADENITQGQSVQERIQIMKEYQEKIGDMNGCWRMQGRKTLLNGLQRENRQILALQEDNRQLRIAVKEYQDTLNLIMSKHRSIVSAFKGEIKLPMLIDQIAERNGVESEKLLQFFHSLSQCMALGELQSQRDQEAIKQLRTENVLLRELLNIAKHNSDGVLSTFRNRMHNSDGVLSTFRNRMCESGSTGSSSDSGTTKEQSSPSGSSESSKRGSSEPQPIEEEPAKLETQENGLESEHLKCNGTLEVLEANGQEETEEEEISSGPLERCRSRDSCASEDTIIFEGLPVTGV
ncbi:hypothetical protein L596_009069 [Steinernema carpocapsae]|uniref:FGFR1 oncogene partner 2 homolog n=1 Tax=Steinernema carpocapsae TaxID=34508 RepID=A0A4U5PFH7_STECR|nr:hypothetical protein L596_009069 [Steinernema carpocapsae]